MQRTSVTALVAVAVGLVACGGSEPPTPAQFRSQVNAVCIQTNKQMSGIQEAADWDNMRRSLRDAAAVLSRGLDELDAIAAPEALADRYEQFKAWSEARRDAALERMEPDGALSARSRRVSDVHHSPLAELAQELRLPGCIGGFGARAG